MEEILLSSRLMKWIQEDERIDVDFDEENGVIITTFDRERYIFENSNLADEEYLRALDITKHNIEEAEAKKNIKKIILEAQYFLETNIELHDVKPKVIAPKVITARIYKF